MELPEGFSDTLVVSGFERPVGAVFAADGRMFVWEQRGIVWVVENGLVLDTPFIDLRPEVNGQWDRGLLGLALDPDFLSNRHVFLLYTVDPVFGEPDENGTAESYGRVTRYTGTDASDGNVADPGSRLVLIGDPPSSGIPSCHSSHTVGSLRFGTDGTLFASAGDGAHFDFVDSGGADPACFVPGLFGPDEDLGAFRSQYLGSLAGKILRIDPASGLGLASNPYWTGDGSDKQSKIWASGLRNPYRVCVRPGSPAPGTVYIGDVGWNTYEEINVAHGGENFGWPCHEGTSQPNGYPNENPASSGCETIETPANPGPLTTPLAYWHHFLGFLSSPPGPTGRAPSGCVFYTGTSYPAIYQDALFHTDLIGGGSGWIRVLELTGDDQLVDHHFLATGYGQIVDLAVAPDGGDLHVVLLESGEIRRIGFDPGVFADINGDGTVDVEDLVLVILQWGPCDSPCDADVDGSDAVDVEDLVIVLLNWG